MGKITDEQLLATHITLCAMQADAIKAFDEGTAMTLEQVIADVAAEMTRREA